MTNRTGPDSARERLIVALDLPDLVQAKAMVAQLGDAVCFYKIGMQLAYSGGLDYVRTLRDEGKQVFLDLKMLDIANTVGHGVTSVTRLGATFVTIHAYPQAMRAAVVARGEDPLKILGVTVLTSLDEDDLAEAGYSRTPEDLVALRVRAALDCGIDGIVASPLEARNIRDIAGDRLSIVTPGIRPTGTDPGDQKRITTPGDAIAAGADYLVVGRPVIAANDPVAVANNIVDEISQALNNRKG
jgi:orotidine-5'-phosphate decarboxylase